MIASDRIPVIALVFGVAYAVIYVICTEMNFPLLTYHPVTGDIGLLREAPKSGPAMYWYGWMLTSFLGAVVAAGFAAVVPEVWLQRTILFGCVAAVAYLVLYTIALYVYDRASVELELLKSRSLAAAIAAVIAAEAVLLLPARWSKRLWPGWASLVPVGALAVLAYYLSPYFTR
ncbi:MAG: hypothetical protein ACJ8F3_15180 [Xanthobacteraceae bacterium]